MNSYPDYKTYQALYKRYYDGRKPKELLDLAGSLESKTVLDLCAGDGRLSLEAIRHGAKQACFIEKQEEMVREELRHLFLRAFNHLCPRLIDYIGDLVQILPMCPQRYFDIAFCQQGINYWLDKNTAKLVAYVLKENGIFIFNTFNKKPSEKPVVKEYELDGKKFVETSWLVGDTVHHVQVREGMEPHTTSFQWLSPEYLEKILSPYFNIQLIVDGHTSIYRCSRK